MSDLLRKWSEELAVGGLTGYFIKSAWKRYITPASLSLSAAGMAIGIPVASGYIASDIIDPVHGERRFTQAITQPIGSLPGTGRNLAVSAGKFHNIYERLDMPLPAGAGFVQGLGMWMRDAAGTKR